MNPGIRDWLKQLGSFLGFGIAIIVYPPYNKNGCRQTQQEIRANAHETRESL